MKKLLLLTKLILFPYIMLSQVVISSSLLDKISNLGEDNYLPIIIELKDEFNILDLKNAFYKNNTPIKERSSIICNKMQQVAKEKQTPIIEFIQSKKGHYQNLYSTWIINAIFIEANVKLINELSKLNNIQSINLQKTQSDIIEYIDLGNNQNQITSQGTEPGIEAINVRPLWELGYTGKGVLVFNYDTGVWPTHPAFVNRFFANHYPMAQCWDGYFSDTPNGHISDHGTHTLGTMAGLVSETNDTIGIAFEAYWIANDFVTSTVETLPPIAEMITSFEWALNPDGDLTTSFDVPDVINNSWRWYNEMDTFQCSGYAVELMNVIESAGIANIFSAGNNGPDNDGVRSPQRINSNLVNTFCVGSINANDAQYPISTFSCRGPTQCPGEGSLAIYPEVVAPGQNVRSAWGTDSYNSISGTSMASPHVSGAVLLLKEAFPFLTGQEILLALYNTASDLGEEGEDNTFGMGIIDAFAAFTYLSNSYTPINPDTENQDILILEVNNTPNQISCSESFSPIISIVNNTDSIINEIEIIYYDNLNETEETNLLFEINLEPYDTTSVQIPNIDNNNYGDKEYSFRINTINPLFEYDYHNNRKMVRFKYKPTLELPYTEDFQSGISYNMWHINNDDYSRTWDTISTGGINDSNIAAYMNLYGYNPRAEQKDELIGPNISLNTDSIRLSFKVAYQKFNNSSKQDTLQIFLSTDCGLNYTEKIFDKGGEELSTYSEITSNFIPLEDNQWLEHIIDLSNYANENIILKFVTTNLRGNNIFIDNINIYDSNNISFINEDKLEISVYPNPSNGLFELSLNNCYIKNIQISNNIGQLIMKPDNLDTHINQYIIDLSDYKPGIYFIDIETHTESKTLQIIKN